MRRCENIGTAGETACATICKSSVCGGAGGFACLGCSRPILSQLLTGHQQNRPPTYSTARLDTLICPILVDSRQLQSCLPAYAHLSLPHLPDVPQGLHPVIVEIWRVQDGLIQVGEFDAHRLWEIAGGAAGLGVGGYAGAALGVGLGGSVGAATGGGLGMWLGPLGWWWGATAGAAAGATLGAAMLAATGAMQGARWAAAAGRRTSENNSRVIGTYNEIIVTVPCRLRRATLAGDFSFVIATYTDSPASMLGEWLVGWGYGKSPAFGKRATDGALEVSVSPSRSPFRVVSRQPWTPVPAHALRSSHVLTAMSHPLLGALPGSRLMLSFLDRSFEDQAVRVTSSEVRLEADDAFLPGLGGFASDIKGLETDHPWGAFLLTGLPVTLSYPCAAE